MKRTTDSTDRKMPSEFTAPQVRIHARDMLLGMGDLLARGASVKAKINAIALATRLNAGRIKRYVYQEVERVPADEYLIIQSWHDRLRTRLGELEQRYNEARKEVLEGDPSLASICPPEIARQDVSAVGRRLWNAQLAERARRTQWGR